MDPKAIREAMQSRMSPEMMQDFEQMFRKLPPVALQRLQELSQRAMRGENVSGEMMMLMQQMPPEFMTKMMSLGMNPAFQEAQAAMQGNAWMPGETSSNVEKQSPVVVSKSDAVVASSGDDEVQMSEEEARAVLEEAVREGRLSREEADELLKSSS